MQASRPDCGTRLELIILKPSAILLGKLAVAAAAIWYLLAKVRSLAVFDLAIGISPAILAVIVGARPAPES